MSTTANDPLVIFPEGFDERCLIEMTDRGYLSEAVVELRDGSRYEVSFIDLARLEQALADNVEIGSSYYAEPGLIVVPEVTEDAVRTAVERLWREGFFQRLKPLRPADRTPAEDERLRAQITETYRRQDWQAALDLLKGRAYLFPPDRLAYLRGRCWAGLGRPETARHYLREAARLAPDDLRYRSPLLDASPPSVPVDEALRRTDPILADGSPSPTGH